MITEDKSTSLGPLSMGLIILLFGVVSFVGYGVILSTPSRYEQGSCFPLAYESATDVQPFDGSPREICFLKTPSTLQQIPKNRMPPDQTGIAFELCDERGEYGSEKWDCYKYAYPRVTVCEHNDGHCSETFRKMIRSFPKDDCRRIIDGYACVSSRAAVVYRKPHGDNFSDVSALLVYDGYFGKLSPDNGRFSANFFTDAEFTDGKKKDTKQ